MNQTLLSKSPLACFAATLFVMSGAWSVYADYKSTVLGDNPAGYWRLDESSGTTATNVGSLGSNENGTYANVTLGLSGALVGDADTAASFNGTSSVLAVPFTNKLNTAVFSIECWVNPTTASQANYAAPINHRVAGSYQGYTFYAPPNATSAHWEFWTGNGSSWNTQPGPSLVASQWAHLVGTYDGTNSSFYVNGALAVTGPKVFVPNSSSALQVGVGGMPASPQYYFSGGIDEVAVYSNALSPAQVLAHYVAARGTNPAPVAPTSQINPTSQLLLAGHTAGLLAEASGSLPLSYQWQFQGTNLAGATNSTLTLASAQVTNSGSYQVVVTNPAGSVTSSVAVVTVVASPGAYSSVVLGDQPVGYWRLDMTATNQVATNLGSLGTAATGYLTNIAAANMTLGIAGALTGSGDNDTAMYVTGAASGNNTTSGYVYVPYTNGLFTPKMSFEIWAYTPGGSGPYSALSARADGGFTLYQYPSWQLWLGTSTGGTAEQTLIPPASMPAIVPNAWTHLVGAADGTTAWLYVNGVLWIQTNCAYVPMAANGTQQPLRIGAGGTSYPYYGWNGGLDEVSIYTNVLTPAQVGNHYLAGAGTVPSPVAPSFPVGNVANVFGPASQTVFIGRSASFQVSTLGSTPFFYQWQTNGVNIPGATNQVYTITNVTLANDSTSAGTYGVAVSNGGGSVMTNGLTLTVLNIQTPTFTTQPQSQALYAGGTARFSALATGGGNLTYQWLMDSTNLLSQTNTTLLLTNVQAASQGTYQVQATNQAGTNLSSLATLTVLAAPGTNTYASYVVADGPVGYWRLDETNGTTAYNLGSLGSAGNGTYTNGVTLGQPGALVGDPDPAVVFGTGAQEVDVPFNAALNPAQFTVELWAKDNGANFGSYRAPLTSYAYSPDAGIAFYGAPNNQWQFWSGTGSAWDVMSGPAVQSNAWTHLAATYDGVTKRFFVNGKQVNSSTAAFVTNAVNLTKMGVGGYGSSDAYFFAGGLDEVAVYTNALSPTRIAAHYAMGLGTNVPPAITVQPVSGTVLAGSNITLSVQATGSLPLSYQWQFYSTNLPGQTGSLLTITNVQAVNGGPYQVVVHNPAGTTNSSVAVVTVVTRTNAYSSVVLADGAVGYWRLDEAAGTTAANLGSLGSTNNGTYKNGVTLGLAGAIAGDPDTCAGFTATNGTTVDVPYAAQLNAPQFTAECWVQMTGPGASSDGGVQSPLTSRNINYQGWMLYGLGGTWQFWTGTGNGFNEIIGPAIQTNSWTHLAATYDGTTASFYVNGVQVGSSLALLAPDQSTVLRMGGGQTESTPGAYFFQGNIDEVAVYTNALAAASIQAHYTIGATGSVATTTVTSSPNPSVYGQSVTFTATVSGLGGTPSGTVAFKAGTTVLGTSALLSGQASFSTNGLLVAGSPYSITAVYNGDSNFSPSTSSVLSQTVSKANSSVTAWPTASAITYGQTLASSTFSGGSVTPAGAFGWTTPATAPGLGTTPQSVTYTPTDIADYNTANSTVSVTVNPKPVTLTGSKGYDGSASVAAASLTVNNAVGSDVVTVVSGTGTLASASAGSQAIISLGNLALGGAAAANYTLTSASGSVTITALPVQLSGPRPYDGSASANYAILSVANKVDGDTISMASGSGTLVSANAGVQAISSFGNLALGNNVAGDYTLLGASGSVTITAASTTNSFAASPNPSLPGADVTFTAAPGAVPPGAGTPTGTVLFKTNLVALCDPVALDTNGVATLITNSLPHGSNTVTAEYAGDGNFLGSTNSVVQIVNTPPTAPNSTAGVTENATLVLSVVKLLRTASDPDPGDTLSVTATGPTSTNGPANNVVLDTEAGTITYTPAMGYVGADSFTYTVSDNFGGTVTPTVFVTVSSAGAPSLTIVIPPAMLPNGHFYVGFAGIPGYSYTIQYSPNADGPWTALTNIEASTDGLFEFEDPTEPAPSSRYYRTVYP